VQIGLIFARARNGVIGKDGGLPWYLPEDLAHFKQVTLGCPVIMGRKTWESLPPRFRPLPNRVNIVVTRQAGWSAEGARTATSLTEALAQCAPAPRAWVIGGAQIYEQAVSLAHVAEVTEIGADYEGDAYAPRLGPEWREISRQDHSGTTRGVPFSFISYRNTRQGD